MPREHRPACKAGLTRDLELRVRELFAGHLREQSLGLAAEVIEIRASGKVLVHGSSMHSPGSATGCTKVVRQNVEMLVGELSSFRGPGGCLTAAGNLESRGPEIQHKRTGRVQLRANPLPRMLVVADAELVPAGLRNERDDVSAQKVVGRARQARP